MNIMNVTMGTTRYAIPLPLPYFLDDIYPLCIMQYWDGSYIVEFPYLGAWGIGNTLEDAIQDLGQSIIDFWKSLKKLSRKHRLLSPQLNTILNRMDEIIDAQHAGKK